MGRQQSFFSDKQSDVVAVRPIVTDIIERIKKETEKQGLLSFVHITVDMAWDLLTLNRGNRDVKETDIARYARDMMNKKWYFLGNTIKIDWDLRLFDGQKELLAIIASGLPQMFHIQCGLDPKAHTVTDVGRMKSIFDTLRTAGFKDVFNHSLIVVSSFS